MGKLKSPWIETALLQADGMLHLETGEAQWRSWFNAVERTTATQFAHAKSTLGMLANAPARTTDGLPSLDLPHLIDNQTQCANALLESGRQLAQQWAGLHRAYWCEQQRRLIERLRA